MRGAGKLARGLHVKGQRTQAASRSQRHGPFGPTGRHRIPGGPKRNAMSKRGRVDMAFVGNLLWFVFGGGIVAWFLWLLAAVLFAITVVGIPFAKAAFRISVFAAFPFGRELIDGQLVGKARILGTGLVNFLWCLLAGFWLAICHVLAGIACCLTIIGIPFGLAHFKLAQVSFAPLGKVIVSSDVARAARARSANAKLDKSLAGK